jgi:hypothetical protein
LVWIELTYLKKVLVDYDKNTNGGSDSGSGSDGKISNYM